MKPLTCDPVKLDGLSEKLIVSHYENNYGGAVKRLNSITEHLGKLDFASAPGFLINGLKREQLVAANSMVLHELYFANLGEGDGPTGALARAIERDFGSVERWRTEFTAMGKAVGGGSGWILLVSRRPADESGGGGPHAGAGALRADSRARHVRAFLPHRLWGEGGRLRRCLHAQHPLERCGGASRGVRPDVNGTLIAVAGIAFVLVSDPAFALRPYDSTDADVAKQGTFELELGPLGLRREDSKRIAVAPAVVGNFGLQGERELVIQGQREVALDRDPDEPRTSIVGNGVFIKQLLRRGALQDAPGPSFATEYGVLLPSVHGEKGTGLSVAGIASQRTEAVSVHLNAVLAWRARTRPVPRRHPRRSVCVGGAPGRRGVRRAGLRQPAHHVGARRRDLARPGRSIVRCRNSQGA
jgi:hypothetical protein